MSARTDHILRREILISPSITPASLKKKHPKLLEGVSVSGQLLKWTQSRKTQSRGHNHNPEWTPSRMDTIPKDTISNGHHTPSRMDTISNGHLEWTPSRMDTMDTIRMDTIPNGHHPEWTPSRMDTIPNGHHPEWAPSRMDTIPNGHHPEWTLT